MTLRRNGVLIYVTARAIILSIYLSDCVLRSYHVNLRGGILLRLKLSRDRRRIIRQRGRFLFRIEAGLHKSDGLQWRKRDNRRTLRLQILHNATASRRADG